MHSKGIYHTYRGRVLLCYGLNNTNVILKDLKEFFEKLQFDIYILELQGHFQESKNIFEVTVDDWIEDFKLSWEKCITSCQQDQLPFYIVSYSISALVIEMAFSRNNFTAQNNYSYLKGIIYFAPAFKIHWYLAAAIHCLYFLGVKKVPSYSPKEIRANTELPIKLYKDILCYISSIKLSKNPKLIFLAQKDEIICSKYLYNHFLCHAISSNTKYQHLIVMIQRLNQNSQEYISTTINTFLSSNG
jgi:alpha-beta hydrolase superfamily lysophospholipase